LKESPFFLRLAVAGLAAALVFAVVFTLVDVYAHWPGLPYRALRDIDLAAGFVFVAGVVWLLLRARGGRDRTGIE
jgi:hypothetical protein